MRPVQPLLHRFILVCAAVILLVGCTPDTFVVSPDPGWHAVEIGVDISSDTAWKSVVDLMAKQFDLEVLSKENGYLRTAWSNTWTGELNEDYRVRALVKFNYDGRIIEFKAEAQSYGGGFLGMGKDWRLGTDERLVSLLKKELKKMVAGTL